MKRTAIACALLVCAIHGVSQVVVSDADPNGVSVPYAAEHLTHETAEWLRANDPFLLYQLGRDLVNRVHARAAGALDRPGEMSVPLYAGDTAKDASRVRFSRDHTSSCGFCHSMPAREPGAGQTIPSTSAMGRNTTHFYGAGLVEMIGEEVRQRILAIADRDGDGFVSRAEAERAGRVAIAPAPGAPPIDFGSFAPDRRGVPQLNPAIRVWYVDAHGRPLRAARSLDAPGVAAFDFALQPFGWGRGRRTHADGLVTSEGGEAATIREIVSLAADVHLGIESADPLQQAEGGFGVARVSLSGARQFDFGQARGRTAELSVGDLDAIEHYVLHAPPPAVRETAAGKRGRAVLRETGCTRCHVEAWRIANDRRLFRIEPFVIADDAGLPQIAARLVRTAKKAFVADGVFSDFRQWDIGPAFHERRYDGSLQKEHRTAPLWGAGSTRPYGHDGRFDTLDDAIRAHGGAAQRERDRYDALPEQRREQLLAFLESLVLWPTDEVPADIDGDGVLSDDYMLAGQHVGPERFDARFLFAVAPEYRVLWDATDTAGRWRRLALIENVREAYRLGGTR